MTTVLLVDDTETVLMAEKMMLSGMGFDIKTASNGVEALSQVQQDKPDIILLDIMMPEMNGIEFCRTLKSTDEFSEIPVIMVTTKGEKQMVQAALEAGCSDYVTKPFNKLILLSKIKTFVS